MNPRKCSDIVYLRVWIMLSMYRTLFTFVVVANTIRKKHMNTKYLHKKIHNRKNNCNYIFVDILPPGSSLLPPLFLRIPTSVSPLSPCWQVTPSSTGVYVFYFSFGYSLLPPYTCQSVYLFHFSHEGFFFFYITMRIWVHLGSIWGRRWKGVGDLNHIPLPN